MRKSPPICLVSCHPVRVGNIPYLIYQTLIKKHFGTPILEDSISVGCYLGVLKCESPPPICMVPCHPLHIGNIPSPIQKTLSDKHVGTSTWKDFHSTSVGCDLGGSKCESPHLSAWFCMVLHGSLPSRAHRQHLI